MGKVTNQSAGKTTPAVQANKPVKPAAPPPPAAPTTPALSERALRRTGKASGFTKSFTPLPPSGSQPLVSDAPVLSLKQAQQQLGGQLPTTPEGLAKAEEAVAFNSGRTAEWSMAALEKNPKKFLRDVVQLDGSLRSTVDRSACGPTSLLMGAIAARPKAVQELASKLVDAKGDFTAAGRQFAARLDPGAREDLHDSLVRLREGTAFTPADVTELADCIQGVEANAGAGSTDLREAAQAIENLGVKLPKMELQLFGNPDGTMGHWRVVSNGTQFNPWPNANGQSTQLPAKDGIKAGSSDGAGWVCRERVTIGGK